MKRRIWLVIHHRRNMSSIDDSGNTLALFSSLHWHTSESTRILQAMAGRTPVTFWTKTAEKASQTQLHFCWNLIFMSSRFPKHANEKQFNFHCSRCGVVRKRKCDNWWNFRFHSLWSETPQRTSTRAIYSKHFFGVKLNAQNRLPVWGWYFLADLPGWIFPPQRTSRQQWHQLLGLRSWWRIHRKESLQWGCSKCARLPSQSHVSYHLPCISMCLMSQCRRIRLKRISLSSRKWWMSWNLKTEQSPALRSQ